MFGLSRQGVATAVSMVLAIAVVVAARAAGESPLPPPWRWDIPASSVGAPDRRCLPGGCFWELEVSFPPCQRSRQTGIRICSLLPQAGGLRPASTGTTGYAESVQVTYDPAQISYGSSCASSFKLRRRPDPAQSGGPRLLARSTAP